MKEPRQDTIMHTPEPPPPSVEAAVHSCGDPEKLTRRQIRRIRGWVERHGVETPTLDDLNPAEAERWLAKQQQIHRARVMADGEIVLQPEELEID